MSRNPFVLLLSLWLCTAAAIAAPPLANVLTPLDNPGMPAGLIFENLAAVSQEVAKERDLTVVLDKKFVFLSAKSLDITPEILNRLDKRLPSVSIKIEAAGKGKGDVKGKK